MTIYEINGISIRDIKEYLGKFLTNSEIEMISEEDLNQEILCSILEKYDPKYCKSQNVQKIGRSVLIKIQKSLKYNSAENFEEVFANTSVDIGDIFFEYMSNKNLEEVLKNTLTHREYMVLKYYFYNDLSFKEIEKLMGLKEHYAKAIFAYALRKLRHPCRKKLIIKYIDEDWYI